MFPTNANQIVLKTWQTADTLFALYKTTEGRYVVYTSTDGVTWTQRLEEDSQLTLLNKYDYLDLVIPHFWASVFGDTREGREGWEGLVMSHGDKVDQYFDDWVEAEIPPVRGALLYLLTYTDRMGDNPKHRSSEWVKQNYSSYCVHFHTAEQAALDGLFRSVTGAV